MAMALLGGSGLLLLSWRVWITLTDPPMDLDQNNPKSLSGVLLPTPRDLLPFALIDHAGLTFDLNRLTGQWTFLFFGYTHCPDVCPVAMGLLTELFALLQKTPKALQKVQGVFVTVDPERDTTQQLKEYVPFFHPDFLGVTGTPADIQTFAKQLGAHYATIAKTDQTEQTISHASVFYLLDPQGRFAALLQPQLHPPAVMADLFVKIRQHYGELP